jgi:pimeloyl-ACP methyl ester carboxylesterase
VDAFVSLAGVGRKTHEALIEQYSKNLPALIGVARAKPLEKQAHRILGELATGRTVADVPKELAEQGLGPSGQLFFISLFKYDPAREIAKLTIPILIVEGTRDRQLRMRDLSSKVNEAKLLAGANKNAELCIIEGMNHFLTSDVWQSLVGNTPLAPLASGLVENISAFLDKTLRDQP